MRRSIPADSARGIEPDAKLSLEALQLRIDQVHPELVPVEPALADKDLRRFARGRKRSPVNLERRRLSGAAIARAILPVMAMLLPSVVSHWKLALASAGEAVTSKAAASQVAGFMAAG